MALPFALAIAVGRYLFLFLLIYTAPYSPCLRHTQRSMATAPWTNRLIDPLPRIAVGLDDFDFATMMVAHLTSVNASPLRPPRRRRQWDPGISYTLPPCGRHPPPRAVGVDVDVNTMTIRLDNNTMARMLSSATMVLAAAPYPIFFQTHPIDLTPRRQLRQWDPGIGPWCLCGRHMQLIVLQMLGRMISYVYQRPAIRPRRLPTDAFVDQVPPTVDASVGLTPSALATFKSIFHYAHPVLSRPTVPNINVFRLPV